MTAERAGQTSLNGSEKDKAEAINWCDKEILEFTGSHIGTPVQDLLFTPIDTN